MFQKKCFICCSITLLLLQNLLLAYAGDAKLVKVFESKDEKPPITHTIYLYTSDANKSLRHAKDETYSPEDTFSVNGHRVTRMVSLVEMNCANSTKRVLWLDYYDNQNHLIKRQPYTNPFWGTTPFLYEALGDSAICKGYSFKEYRYPTYEVPPVDPKWASLH